jgi:hypothetical protein
VTTVAAANIFGTAAKLNATVNPNYGASTYWFVYGTNNSTALTNLTTPASLGASNGVATVASSLTGLMPGTPYYFEIVATNLAGSSTGTILSFTTGSVSAAPTVTTVAASSITASTAKLNGTVNPNNDAATYWFVYGTNNTTALTNLTATAVLAATNTTSPTLSSSPSGLLPGTTYYFKFVATNSLGTSAGSVLNFTTSVPLPTVTPLAAFGISAHAATLGAIVNPNNALTGYWFKYGTSPASLNTLTTTNPLAASYSAVTATKSISGLTPATTYYFEVLATNSSGTVVSWNTSFTTLPLPTVLTLAASNITPITAVLNGAVNPNNTAVTYWFNYGTTTGYGSSTTPGILAAGSSWVTNNAAVVGLQPGTVYHYQIVATNTGGMTTGADVSFTALQLGGSLNGGLFNYVFTNATGGSYSILSTNNLTAPRATWPAIGTAVENPSGSGYYMMTNQITPTNADAFFIWKTNSP